ncbi:MAG: MYXO-CTERM sorting domain-containing protein [Myxococcota bacterium]
MRSWSLTTSLVLLTGLLTGGETLAASGGPDALGYRFDDQAEGVTYNFVDISTTGMVVADGLNETAPIVLPVPFTIYGQLLNDIVVSTNGFITDMMGDTVDPTNDCPLPTPPSGSTGSFRIAAFHTTLIATVYYEYFDQVAANMIGFPGQASGVSIIQWTGQHEPPRGLLASAQIVLFHDDDSMRIMVATDDLGGAQSTIGIQNPDATVGLTYGCNNAGFITPGVTAVQFTPGPPPDSDCCTQSAGGIPGCIEPACQAAVCDANPNCCAVAWDAACAMLAADSQCAVLCGNIPPVRINEIRIDQPGGDGDEYFELVGPPGFSLYELTYVVLGDDPTGTIEEVVDLTGQSIPPSGHFVAASGSFSLSMADLTTPLNFENEDTVTHLLVGGFSGSNNDELDTDVDGVLDMIPWVAQVDTVAILGPMGSEFPYGPGSSCVAGPTCHEIGIMGATPQQIYRCENETGPWTVGNNDPAAMPATDTPGAPNVCPCGNGNVDPGEDCDDMGESANCDADCTLAMCGDDITNATAGEECDDGNTDDGDGCSALCTLEGDSSTGGSSTGDSSTGGPSTGEPSETTGLDGTLDSSAGSTTTGSTSTTPIGTSSGTTGGSDTDSGGIIVPLGEGCNCTTGPSRGGPRRVPWSAWALLGLGALSRRRRRA